jgi:hypothetical protein
MEKQQLLQRLHDRFAVAGPPDSQTLTQFAEDLRCQSKSWDYEITTCDQRGERFLARHYRNEQAIDLALLRQVDEAMVMEFLEQDDDDLADEFDLIFGDPVEKAFDMMIVEALLA